MDFPQCREITDYFLQEFPEGAKAQDSRGHLPLHVACQSWRWDAVRMLITAYPDGVRTQAGDDGLPIHFACADFGTVRMPDFGLDMFALLVERYPESLNVRNEKGRLPLHCACEGSVPVEVLQEMIHQYPDAMKAQDRDGDLPLHVACKSRTTTVDQIRVLVEADPLLLLRKRVLGGETPLQCAHSPSTPEFMAVEESLQREKITFLLAEQERVVERHRLAAIEFVERRRAAVEFVAGERLDVDDLVTSKIWDFAKPDVWTPEDEDE